MATLEWEISDFMGESPNLSFEHLLALVSAFEGLALWKLPELTRNNVQEVDLEGSCKSIRGKSYTRTVCKQFFFCCLSYIFFGVAWLGKFLRWTPGIWCVGLPLLVFYIAQSRSVDAVYLSDSNSVYCIIFYFMLCKFLLGLAILLYNKIYMAYYKKIVQNKRNYNTSLEGDLSKI